MRINLYILVAMAYALIYGAESNKTNNYPSLEQVISHANYSMFLDVREIKNLNDIFDNVSPDCEHHLQIYSAAFINMTEWALKMFDATAKLQSGVLHGNIYNLGSYDECQEIHNIPVAMRDTEKEYITGKYCLGTLMLELKGESFPLMLSTCLPDKCSAEDLNSIAKNLHIPMYFDDLKCHSRNQDPTITNGDIALIVCFGIIAFIMLTSSLYDCYLYYTHKETLHPLLLAFSVVTNGKKLFSTRKSKSSDQLECLAGVRTLSMMWVLIGHTFSNILSVAMTDMLKVLSFSETNWTMYIRGATVSVDTFFLMGGIVMSYVYMKSKTQKCFNVFHYYLHRYLRLTPALAALLVVHLTVLKHFGGGPFWPTMDLYAFNSCKKYWWSTLLYIQNYVNPYETCLGQSWYLSVDMQLFFISPLFLIPLKYWPRAALAMSLLGAAASISSAFAVAWIYKLQDLTISLLDTDPTKMEDYMTKYYTATYSRAAPWFIGLIVGYIIHHVKIVRGSFKMSKLLNIALWISSLTVLFTCVFYDINENADSRGAVASYITFVRPAWAIALSWIIFACVNGYGGPINAFLSLPIFQIMARLTYSMYITHFTIIIVLYLSKKQPIEFSNAFMMYEYWSLFMLVFFISVVWTLAFESPVIIIEKYLLGGSNKKPVVELTKEKPNGNTDHEKNDVDNNINGGIASNGNNTTSENGYVNNAYVS